MNRSLKLSPTLLIAIGLGALAVAIAGVVAIWMFMRGAQAPPTVVQTAQAGDVRVTMQLDDAALGPRVIDVLLRDAAGAPIDAEAVRLRFTMAEMDMGQIEVDAQPLGRGRYQARGLFFSMVGAWQVQAMLDRGGQPPAQASFAVAIAAPGEASGPLNPLISDAATVAAGQVIYQANCVVCHGANGRGDGPLAAGLSPRPSDFAQHMPIGKHTDGQIFLWIKDGYPGTAMPAWGARLSDEQIWQLVTYLRTFGQVAVATADAPVGTPTAAVATAAPVDVREPLPPMVFARERGLWRSAGDGQSPRQLISLDVGYAAEHPAISPDGAQIAFILREPPPLTATLPISTSTLYVMSADGSGQRELWRPPSGVLGSSAWMPDGQTIYVGLVDVRSEPSAPVIERVYQIVSVNLATGEPRVIREDAREPALTRDGQRMAYVGFNQAYAAATLHIAAPDGSDDRELIGPGAFTDFSAPRFSSDGARLVFAAIGGPPTDEQGNPLTARAPSLLDSLLGWLEPQAALAHGAPWDIWTINADGSGLRRLPQTREDTPMAQFSPDGAQIIMMGAGGIYLMDADGGNLRRIDPLGDHGGLDWAGP